MFGTYFVVALISGQLTARIREQERNERMREDRATALFHLTQALSAARTLDDGVFAALRQADAYFGRKTALLLDDGNGSALMPHFAGSFTLNEKERGVADWAWRNRKKAGRFTDTLPLRRGIPPAARAGGPGGRRPHPALPPDSTLTLAQRDLAESFATQLAQLVEREQLRAAGEREKLLAESDKLHRTLLDGVSHELKTPLAVLSAAVENLPPPTRHAAPPGRRDPDRHPPAEPPGQQPPRPDPPRVGRAAGRGSTGATGTTWSTPRSTGSATRSRATPSRSTFPKDLPLFRADAALMEQVIANLLLNSALHTPRARRSSSPPAWTAPRSRFLHRGRPGARAAAGHARAPLPEIPAGRRRPAGGLGLGLSIIRGFVTAQGGEVVAGENPGGGAVLTVYLPHLPRDVPAE
jgi:two-component system, OmpR family, sensor histidine kinase KdpD